jgi:hypothetical protein
MGQDALPTACGVMREDARESRSIEMAPLSRLMAIAALLAAAAAGALFLEAFLSFGAPTPFAHTKSGHVIGWIGLGFILLVFIYPIKKRMNPNRRWPRGWFRLHIAGGIIGPLLIFLHAGAHVHALVPLLALATLVVVVVSGIVGQGVHYLAIRTLHDRRQRLHEEGISDEEIDLRLHRLAAQEEAFRLWQSIHAPLTLLFAVLAVMHIVGALYFGGL